MISPCLQVRQYPLQFVDAFCADQAGDHRIPGACDELRWLTGLRILPRRCQLPVAVDVAVPVQSAAKTGSPIGRSEEGKTASLSQAGSGWLGLTSCRNLCLGQ